MHLRMIFTSFRFFALINHSSHYLFIILSKSLVESTFSALEMLTYFAWAGINFSENCRDWVEGGKG